MLHPEVGTTLFYDAVCIYTELDKLPVPVVLYLFKFSCVISHEKLNRLAVMRKIVNILQLKKPNTVFCEHYFSFILVPV